MTFDRFRLDVPSARRAFCPTIELDITVELLRRKELNSMDGVE
jgi:hypothetical protein